MEGEKAERMCAFFCSRTPSISWKRKSGTWLQVFIKMNSAPEVRSTNNEIFCLQFLSLNRLAMGFKASMTKLSEVAFSLLSLIEPGALGRAAK